MLSYPGTFAENTSLNLGVVISVLGLACFGPYIMNRWVCVNLSI
jgi:hypothetical protein